MSEPETPAAVLPDEERIARVDRFVARSVGDLKSAVAILRGVQSPFVKGMQEAMTAYHEMRGQGYSREDCVKGLEHVLREQWPTKREWHLECERCRDTGWQPHTCRPGLRCQRPECADDSGEHSYVTECPCRLTNKTYKRHHGLDEDATSAKIAAAATTSKRR